MPAWCAAISFQIGQRSGSDKVLLKVAGDGEYKLEVDDASNFHAPVWSRTFRGRELEFAPYDVGMAPGTDYYVRLNGSAPIKRLRIAQRGTFDLNVNCKTMRTTWETIGRPFIERRSSVHWQADRGWVGNPVATPDGLNIYFVELYLRSALESAQSCEDLGLYDEASQYYLVMLGQTVPLGRVERRASDDAGSRTGMMAFRTFPTGGKFVGDNDLGQAQWLYPAAKLERLISLLPISQRSPAMRQFTSVFTGFLVDEQILRFLTRPGRPAPGGGPDVSRIEVWQRTLRGLKGKNVWDTAMSDVDLWLLASSAEVLGAHANAPELVKLTDNQAAQLHLALNTGISLFRSKRTLYPDTKDFQGSRVGSASYFNGDYDTYWDFEFSATTGAEYPAADKKGAIPNLSWDTAHAYRLPVFMRALYDNRKATNSDFPRTEEMRLLTNQYVYRVFNGNFLRPLFRNYLDGNDSWFRVDLSTGSGYPPSEFCDDLNSTRPCMSPGNIVGWGLLAFVNPDLAKVEQALVTLAFQDDAEARQFRNRHYTYTWPYGLITQNGNAVYGDSLYCVLADNGSMLADAVSSQPSPNS